MVSQSHHRSEEEIVADILAVVNNGNRKTRIMYGANLSYALTTKYLKKLVGCNLIQYNNDERKYVLTTNGKRYLGEYSEYKNIEDKLIEHNSLFKEKRGLLIQMLSDEQVL